MARLASLRVLAIAGTLACAAQAAAQVMLYEHEGFAGRSVRVTNEANNLRQLGFNDRASSLVVERGRYEVCDDARFTGRCVVVRSGQYASLAALGLDDRVSSVRAVSRSAGDVDAAAPYYAGRPEFRRRGGERLYAADVTAVRAVVGPPEQRCWIEQERVVEGNGGPNVPAAIAGAVIGGILGHQIGGGRGQDIATAGGAVGGAALGANIGRGSGASVVTRDVQKCAYARSGPPQYYDVTYVFRGVEHRVQTTSAPGPTIAVNRYGEPRW